MEKYNVLSKRSSYFVIILCKKVTKYALYKLYIRKYKLHFKIHFKNLVFSSYLKLFIAQNYENFKYTYLRYIYRPRLV